MFYSHHLSCTGGTSLIEVSPKWSFARGPSGFTGPDCRGVRGDRVEHRAGGHLYAADNVVLDVFQVCDEELRHVEDISRLKQMEQLLAVAFSPNGDGESVLRTWMQCAGAREPAGAGKAAVLTFDNDRFDDYTVLQVEAPDRVGLLHDILEAISTCDVDIVHAVIVTEEDQAADVFFMTGTDGRKIRDATRLEQIRDMVRAALG